MDGGGAPVLDDPTRPHTALVLLDCQKAFLNGDWAEYFGGRAQVGPIQEAFERTLALLGAPWKLSGCVMLCTRCYTDGEEAEYIDSLAPFLREVPWVWKPTMDITQNARFHTWMEAQLSAGVKTFVIGGCTTTSCVRVSSQAVRKAYPDPSVRVVVDLSLCGARTENYEPNAESDPVLVRIYGRDGCRGRSPVDLAKLQMSSSGVEVMESFEWDHKSTPV